MFQVAEHKYQKIAYDLQNKIMSGDLAGKNSLPSELLLSQRYKVNRRTIRQAVNLLEEKKIVSKVENKKRKILISGIRQQNATVAFVALGSNAHNSFINLCVHNLFDEIVMLFQRHGVKVIKIIFDTNSPEKIPETVYSDAIDLFILFGDIDQEVFSGRKYITIGSNILTTDKISLQPDGAFAAMDMYDYLFSQGHRKIGLLLPLINYFFFSDMRSGYFSACGTRNIRPRIFEIESEHLTEQFTQIHEELSELDALILCTSCGAPEVISSLKDIGLSVPDNLSLIAVGGYEDCEKTRPRLTCYENDYPAMAKTLWQFLSGFFSGTITQPLRVSSKTFKLIERDSVCKRH